MIHDLDLMMSLVNSPVASVEALGVSIFGTHEDIANARLHFANGCVADVTASRAHPTPHRQMHLWGAEGYAGLDFIEQHVTLVQPSAPLRSQGLDPAQLDPAARGCLKDELFGRHFQMCTIGGPRRDQLAGELEDFVHCVQTGTGPRVGGSAGRDAVAVAERILASLRSHSCGRTSPRGPLGPVHLPVPWGRSSPRTWNKKWRRRPSRFTRPPSLPHSSLLTPFFLAISAAT